MQNRIAVAAAAIALAFTAPALAQSEEEVSASIETIHGDSEGFFELYAALQDAILLEDPTAIADHAFYPLRINTDGESQEVPDAEALVDDFHNLIWPETLEALGTQDVADLIVTSEGVGIGNGAIWLTNICLDDSCAETQWGILSINN